MKKILLYHKVFWIIIGIQLFLISLFYIVPFLLGYGDRKYYRLKYDCIIMDSNNNIEVGFLKKGVIIRKSSREEYNDMLNGVNYYVWLKKPNMTKYSNNIEYEVLSNLANKNYYLKIKE